MDSQFENKWCFLHRPSGRALMGLTDFEAKSVVMAIGTEDLSWYVWCTPWPEWQTVDKVYELHEPFNRTLDEQPPALPGQASDSVLFSAHSVVDGPQGFSGSIPMIDGSDEPSSILQLENVAMDDDASSGFVIRKTRRFNKRFDISILANDQIFETFSVDISVGGVRLESPLPHWVSGYFKVRIKKPTAKQIIELSACLLEGEGPVDRYRVSILPLQNPADEANLEIWLAS